jgi:enoyl-CoA hydratase/carnithine racemase
MDADALAAVSTGGSFSQQGRIRQTMPLAIPKPIVAAINGACAGIGLVQALMCDIRFCARTAKISTAFARRGLPAENAVAWLLGRLAGQGVAADLLLSARVITADEALELGIVNRVVHSDELLEVTQAYATDLAASCSPAAMAQIKAQLYQSLDSELEAARRDAKRAFEQARNAPDFREGIASFMEKRSPRFEGLGVHLAPEQFRD